ncbi:MAG: Serine-tRNA ligase [Candidatus Wolfebacteria bacterium GW2011_GWA2_42_10]|uniref:Serine--tRNA ligase n=2 Tax=Candidatus Wolfeibacteriota TaxID=1752735 RepID=A0A0G0ZUH0_9BACT|nr:MAG: Serine-tRNA ligase [Candidatus Wolfebacteria bacterium GW2011_GWB1_41_12]KKS25636.1 MAG: Serine-tRNA ligase [Candidatus Wolfebacteria bacterium GW2011_GWA2_42_10]KKT56474.1 MAG: Serine-tRNA ligase [Candidatus Wolfebacteria bacterium GW2011_GWA1_44_24]
MLDINLIRSNPELVKKGVISKNINPKLIDDFLILDKNWRESVGEIDNLRAGQKKFGKENAEEAKKIKNKIQETEDNLKQVEAQRQEILEQLPNLPLENVPIGKNEKDNIVIREVGEKPKFNFKPKDYLELAEKLDLIDIERAARVSGSRFGYLKNQAALLEFALLRLVFDNLTSEGFIPIVPPVMIKEEIMKSLGYIDSAADKEERYFFEKDGLYLVGTAEQSIIPMHSNEIFDEKELPRRYIGFSSCFRREAGSYGKDTKGILRVHQFDKAEMISFAEPEKSGQELEFLLKMAENLMQKLKIPYRVIQLCSGDLSRPSAITYDIESWMPGQNTYRETHSISNTTDFQSRRLNIKYRSQKSEHIHILNGTAFAIGRILIAIIENYQQEDGSIFVPQAIQQYLKFEKIG